MKHITVGSAAHRGQATIYGSDDLDTAFKRRLRLLNEKLDRAVERCRKRQLLVASECDQFEMKGPRQSEAPSHYGWSSNARIEGLADEAIKD